jgi:hypothetical protein
VDDEHSARHGAVVRAWHRACKAAFGSTVRAEHAAHERYSPRKRPDVTVFNEGENGGATHLLLEVKTLSSLSSKGKAKFPSSEHVLLGGIAQEKVVERDYQGALARNHTVVALLHSSFGALDPTATRLLSRLDAKVKSRLPDPGSAPWTARSFRQLHAQSITTAVQLAAARQVLAAASNAFDGSP